MKRTLMMATTKATAVAHHHCPKATQSSLLLLSERDVQKCLDIKDCLAVNRKAYIALAQGQAHVPTRIGLPYNQKPTRQQQPSAVTAAAQDWTLFKPAAYYPHHHHSSSIDNDKNEETATTWSEHDAAVADSDNNDESRTTTTTTTTLMGCKIVSVRANNPSQNLPLVPATIVSINAETGLVQAIVAGTYLTAARTAAGSALSTALVYEQRKRKNKISNSLSPSPFQHLVVFGAGLQAKLHIQAIATAMSEYNNNDGHSDDDTVSPIPLVSIINRTEQRAVELKNEILGNNNNNDQVCWAQQVQTVLLDDIDAVAKTLSTANVVVTATNTMEPLWNDNDDSTNMMMLPHGCHITGVGSYTPEMREVPFSTVRKCHVIMDTPEARLVGDLKDLPDSHPMTLIGHALLQQQNNINNNDTNDDEMTMMDYTFFKSVGTAIQDVMTADMIVQRARELNIGQEIDMS